MELLLLLEDTGGLDTEDVDLGFCGLLEEFYGVLGCGLPGELGGCGHF